MNTNELILGNYVEFENKLHQVIGITDDEINLTRKSNSGKSNITYWVGIYSVKPIPLTEKWLLDFSSELDRGVFRLPKLKGYFNLLNLKGNLFYEYNIHQVKMCKLQYVYQLQNLYFSLTSTHLQLVDPK